MLREILRYDKKRRAGQLADGSIDARQLAETYANMLLENSHQADCPADVDSVVRVAMYLKAAGLWNEIPAAGFLGVLWPRLSPAIFEALWKYLCPEADAEESLKDFPKMAAVNGTPLDDFVVACNAAVMRGNMSPKAFLAIYQKTQNLFEDAPAAFGEVFAAFASRRSGDSLLQEVQPKVAPLALTVVRNSNG